MHNDDGLFPNYTGHLIKERPDNWNYCVIKTHHAWLYPLLEALRRLHEEGQTAALVLSVVHHRRVLPSMSRPQRMDEMGPCVLSWDREACRMSNKALLDEEVAARVRVAVSGDFQPEHVNTFPMKPNEGYYDLVSLSSY